MDPPLGKRVSKLPQRLTHTRLGMMISSAAVSGDKSSTRPDAAFSPSSSMSSATSEVAGSSSTHGHGNEDPPLPDSLHPWPHSTDYGGEEGHSSFLIRLTFPEGHLCDQNYLVDGGMTVRLLERRLAWLLQTRLSVFMFVHPRWEQLDHAGFITDRLFPGTNTECPYLENGSLLRVLTTLPVEVEDWGAPKSPLLVDDLTTANATPSGDDDMRPQKKPKRKTVTPDHYSLDSNQSSCIENPLTNLSFLSSPYSESKSPVVSADNEVLVSFREREVLRKLFQNEYQRERRAYRAQMKLDFEAEIPPIDFVNLPPPPTDANGNSNLLRISDAEMVAEASAGIRWISDGHFSY